MHIRLDVHQIVLLRIWGGQLDWSDTEEHLHIPEYRIRRILAGKVQPTIEEACGLVELAQGQFLQPGKVFSTSE
jgi:hypothetical protein